MGCFFHCWLSTCSEGILQVLQLFSQSKTTILKFQFELELDHFTRLICDILAAYCVGTVILKVLYSMGIKQKKGILP